MALDFDDRWVWDFWLVRDGDDHHVFYLQAPTEIGDPEARHWNVSIGHAVSRNLRDWTVLPDALAPGEPGSWDDASTWTGSVVRHDGLWHLLYTGTSTVEDGQVQRIGLATSPDLLTWTRAPGPVLEADHRWYETPEDHDWHDVAWRDPWVFVHPDDGDFHVLVTARVRHGLRDERGVVGHARSSDLRHWEVLPPVTAPIGLGQLEVPQLRTDGDRAYLIFCSDVDTQGERWRREGPGTGTYYLIGDAPLGPFLLPESAALEADRAGSTYAGKLHEDNDGRLVFLAWHRTRPDGGFHGALSDPRSIVVGPDGALSLAGA